MGRGSDLQPALRLGREECRASLGMREGEHLLPHGLRHHYPSQLGSHQSEVPNAREVGIWARQGRYWLPQP